MKYLAILVILILSVGLVSAECTDSDGGKNKYEFGGVTSNGETFSDKCEGDNIQEAFCTADNIASYTLLPCVNGCEEGVCIVESTPPKSFAPEGEEDNNIKLYWYIAIILLIVGFYVYWFKFRKR